MKTRFLALFLLIPLLAACSPTKEKPTRTAYRWEIYDVNFTYPADFNIIEDRRLVFNGQPFDALIMTSGNLTSNISEGFEIEAIAQNNTTIEDMLVSFDGIMDYEDRGSYKMGKYEFRKICYESSGHSRCSYLIEKNRNYYQFNLKDGYRDDFLRSLEFVM